MIKKSFNFLFWFSIVAFIGYHVGNHFDSFDIASTYYQEEKYEEADVAISKYNSSAHFGINTINGYILQSEISNKLDRLYLGKELASHALYLSTRVGNKKSICISQNAIQKTKLLIGDLSEVEKHLLQCLEYFKSSGNDFDSINTLNNLATFNLITNNKKYLDYFEEAEKIISKKKNLNFLMVDSYVEKMFFHIQNKDPELAKIMIDKAIVLQKKHFPKQINKLSYLEILSFSPLIGDNNLQALKEIHGYIDNQNLKMSVSHKIHILLIISKIYNDLEDYENAIAFDLKALDLLHTFPIKEIHAIEASFIYKSLIDNYQKIGNKELQLQYKNQLNIILEKFPLLKNIK